MTASEFDFNLRKVRRSFSAAAQSYDAAALLQQEVARRVLERLDYVRLQPGRVLDVGAGTGYCTHELLRRYPKSHVLALDFAEGMLHKARQRGRIFRRPTPLCADAAALPLAGAVVDLLFSNLMLQWCHPVDRYFAEFRRVIGAGGLFMFTTFGPDTLVQLRQAWAKVDDGVHVHGFLDMHDLGDALLRSGFSDPVMDVETITVNYPDLLSILKDLKAIGATNAGRQRARGLTGRNTLRLLTQAYDSFRDADGLLPLSYEVVYGHAWVPDRPAPSAWPDRGITLQPEKVRK